MPVTITSHILNFANYLKFQKRYSVHTLLAYTNDLEDFRQFIEKEFAVTTAEEVSPAMVRTWLASLKQEDNTATTINRKISSLRSFFKSLVKNQVLDQGPMGSISSPKNAKRLPQFVDSRDISTLFSAVEFSADWQGMTERLILEILYGCGLRQAELISLQQHHVDLLHSSIKVLGKGNKERVIPIAAGLRQSIAQYIALKKLDFPGQHTGPLLLNKKGNKLYPRYVYDVVKKYLSLVTTIEKRSPHILRHTFATHLTNNGADINAIKELMGHSSLAATQIYTHNSIEKLKDAYKKAHPKA